MNHLLVFDGYIPFSASLVNKIVLFYCVLDINECDFYPCHSNATCSNIRGSYICICDVGYTGDGIQCHGM